MARTRPSVAAHALRAGAHAVVNEPALLVSACWVFAGAFAHEARANILDLFIIVDALLLIATLLLLALRLRDGGARTALFSLPALYLPAALALRAAARALTCVALFMAAAWDVDYVFAAAAVALVPLWAGPLFARALAALLLTHRGRGSTATHAQGAAAAVAFVATPVVFSLFASLVRRDTHVGTMLARTLQIVAPAVVAEPFRQAEALLLQRHFLTCEAWANAQFIAAESRAVAPYARTADEAPLSRALCQTVPTALLDEDARALLRSTEGATFSHCNFTPPVCDLIVGALPELAGAQSAAAWRERFLVRGVVQLGAGLLVRFWPLAALSWPAVDAVRADLAAELGVGAHEVDIAENIGPMEFAVRTIAKGLGATAGSELAAELFENYSGALPGILSHLFGFYPLDDRPFRPDSPGKFEFGVFVVVCALLAPALLLTPGALVRPRAAASLQEVRKRKTPLVAQRPWRVVLILVAPFMVALLLSWRVEAVGMLLAVALIIVPVLAFQTFFDVQRARAEWDAMPSCPGELPVPPLFLNPHARLLEGVVEAALDSDLSGLVPGLLHASSSESYTSSYSTITSYSDSSDSSFNA